MGDKIRINIESGQGITQAIQKKLVDEGAENNNGVVRTSIWSQVQGFFATETQSESENEISILHHKDSNEEDNIGDLWHTFEQWKIPTEVDDYIEIARSTWNKILQLVGLEPEGDDSPASETDDPTQAPVTNPGDDSDVPTQDPTAPETDDSTPTPIVSENDPNPPVADENPPADASPAKNEKVKNDKKHPQAMPAPVIEKPKEMTAEEIQALNTADELKARQTITNEDGTTTEYDEQGRIKKVRDAKGNVIKDIGRGADGKVTQVLDVTKGDSANTTISVLRDAEGKVMLQQYFEHDKKDNVTMSVTLYNNEIRDYYEYEYDRKGRKTKEIKRDKDGNVVEYTTYKYSRKGVVQEITYDKDGKVQNRDEYKYNKNGFVSSIISTDSEGKYIGQDDYEYYQNGYKKREISRNSEGKVFEYIDYEYDTEGNCTKKVVRDSEGKVKHYRKYNIDDSGQRTYIKYDSSGKELDRGKATD